MYNLLPQSCGQPGPLNPNFRYKRIKDYIYDTENSLGRGNFSSVFPAWRDGREEQLAVKVVRLSQLNTRKLEELLEQETAIICQLSHPNIIRCHEVLRSCNHCYIITELCEQGNLEKTLQLKGPIPEANLWPYLRDIHQGLKYLASRHIVHRDLKTANIFLTNGIAKIADFGFAAQSREPFYDMNIGSPFYMSPEGFLNNRYSQKTDVWAFGVVIYEILHGKTPFQHCLNDLQLRNCMSQQISVDLIRSDISADLKELIIACLQIDESRRISIEEIEKLPYIQKQLFPAIPSNPSMATYKQTETTSRRSLGKTDHQVAIIVQTNQPTDKVDKENLHFKKHHHIRKSCNEKGKVEMKQGKEIRVQVKKISTLNQIDVDDNRSVMIVSQQKMLKGKVSFNQSIGLIHFCRIGYKFMQEGLENEPKGMVGALIIEILQEILEKVKLGEITYDVCEDKQVNEFTLKKVLQQYLLQYRTQCTSKQPAQLNLQKVQQILTSELARIQRDQNATPQQCYVAMTFLIYAEYLRWGSLHRNYRIFAENGSIDTCLDDKNIPSSLTQYQQIKRKYLATLAA